MCTPQLLLHRGTDDPENYAGMVRSLRRDRADNRSQHAPPRSRERLERQCRTRPAEQVALEQITTEIDECTTLVLRLYALTNNDGTPLMAQVAQRADRALLECALVNVAYQGHVDLDHLGHQLSEAGQPGVTSADVIDRQPEPERAETRDALGQIQGAAQRCALGDLEDHVTRNRRQR